MTSPQVVSQSAFTDGLIETPPTAQASLPGQVQSMTTEAAPASDEPVFVARELVDIYRDAVAGGFEPYYECHDEDRFVATFVSRQGLGLRLAPMPERQRMLGLSYPGGLSRDTTAVLCEVDRRPVMLFVDRMAADRVQLELAAQDGIGLYRRELQGLVIYEVTPLDDARMTDYLVIAPRRK